MSALVGLVRTVWVQRTGDGEPVDRPRLPPWCDQHFGPKSGRDGEEARKRGGCGGYRIGIMTVRVARVYDKRKPDEGRRVLVDRLWPRGIRRDDERIDEWLPDVAPSTDLRRWYGHEVDKFDEFARRYASELNDDAHREAFDTLRDTTKKQTITLVTATKDVEHSQARVLTQLLDG